MCNCKSNSKNSVKILAGVILVSLQNYTLQTLYFKVSSLQTHRLLTMDQNKSRGQQVQDVTNSVVF